MTTGNFADDVRTPLTPPADVNTKDTGQSILDNGLKDFLDRMGNGHLGYLYNYWAKVGIWKAPDAPGIIGDGDGDKGDLKPFLTMNFGYMDGCAKGLDNLAKSSGAIGGLTTKISGQISSGWTDKAGQAAVEKFGELQTAAATYTDSVQAFATAMHTIWGSARQAVQTLAKFPSSDDSPAVGGNGGARFMGLYGTEDKWNVAEWCTNIDQISHLLTVKNPMSQQTSTDDSGNVTYDDNTGHNFTPQELATPGTVMIDGKQDSANTACPTDVDLGLDRSADHLHSDQVIQKMNDFNNNYAAVVKNYRQLVKNTTQQVSNLMDNLQDAIKTHVGDTNPFAKLSVTAPPPAPSPAPSGGASQSGGSNGSSGGGQHTGGGGGGGGGGSSAGTSAASYSPPPISPSTVGGGGAVGSGGAPTGSDPSGAGAMPTIPPISTPVGSTGTSTSSAGGGSTGTGTGTGLPGTGTGTSTGLPGSTPETMTVQSGGNTIGMSSPDSQGNVQLTVDNGSGQPQTYDIGFGQGAGATGASGAPGSIPMQPQGTAMPGGGGFGPTGTPMDPSQVAGAAGVQHITPGADGSAVIHDGNLTITATEPQGQNGPVQISVNDGSGHTSTYTLGGGDPTGGASQMQPLTGTTGTDPSSLSSSVSGGGYTSGVANYGDPSSAVNANTAGFTAPSTYQPDSSTSASAWLSPDAASQAHTAAAMSGVGGTVSGHVGDASGLVGGGVGGGGMHDGGSAGLAAMSSGGGSGISSVLGGPVNHAAGAASGVGDVGLANTDVSHAAAPGGAGLAQAAGGQGQASGGMPMMGGMGGMGGGQGGDTERGASQWRTQGHLFDNVMDDSPASGFSGVLGEETGEQNR